MNVPADTPLNELTPLELFTRISICLLLADGRMDFEERETWAKSLYELFPDHNPDHALEILMNSTLFLNELSASARLEHAKDCADHLGQFYSREDCITKIYPQLEAMAESDGVVMSSEDDFLLQIKGVFEKQ
ncbi:MAG: hypothetical protein GXO90_09425 [FCB group bacterium]|nr:hypothetical protein [FCB group bacterium]